MTWVGPWRRPRIAYQVSITALFVAVVLLVGVTLVMLSLDRAREITRTAAIGFIDQVAHHTADRIDGQFRAAAAAVGVLLRLASRKRFYQLCDLGLQCSYPASHTGSR